MSGKRIPIGSSRWILILHDDEWDDRHFGKLSIQVQQRGALKRFFIRATPRPDEYEFTLEDGRVVWFSSPHANVPLGGHQSNVYFESLIDLALSHLEPPRYAPQCTHVNRPVKA